MLVSIGSLIKRVKTIYDNNLMVALPELFEKSIRCQDLSKIKDVSLLKGGKDEWCVKYVTNNNNCTYSENTPNKNGATQAMNDLLAMINTVDLMKTTM